MSKHSPLSKPIKYQPTGGGRDSYIIIDSGGFYKPRIDNIMPRIGFQIHSVQTSLSPKKDSNPPVVGASTITTK